MDTQVTVVRADNPAEQARLLREAALPTPRSVTAQSALDPWKDGLPYIATTSLSADDGKFVLHWQLTARPGIGSFEIDKWDWVGVFKSANDAENDPAGNDMRGGWEWVESVPTPVNGSYKTRVNAQSGNVAAYISWNYITRQYVAIAVSDPF